MPYVLCHTFACFVQLAFLKASLFCTMVAITTDYCTTQFYGFFDKAISKLQHVQNLLGHNLTFTVKKQHISPILGDLYWLHVSNRIISKLLILEYFIFLLVIKWSRITIFFSESRKKLSLPPDPSDEFYCKLCCSRIEYVCLKGFCCFIDVVVAAVNFFLFTLEALSALHKV